MLYQFHHQEMGLLLSLAIWMEVSMLIPWKINHLKRYSLIILFLML